MFRFERIAHRGYRSITIFQCILFIYNITADQLAEVEGRRIDWKDPTWWAISNLLL